VAEGKRVCALDGCGEWFRPPARAPHKRFCCERHQRIAEKRRYRERHVEWATCKGCGEPFERSAVDGKSREFHSLACQCRSRSVSYRGRADVLANIAPARKGGAA
jgi:hypothetical protein